MERRPLTSEGELHPLTRLKIAVWQRGAFLQSLINNMDVVRKAEGERWRHCSREKMQRLEAQLIEVELFSRWVDRAIDDMKEEGKECLTK
jgi:hypothetical protein